MICKNCGTATANDVNFCPNCGASVTKTPLNGCDTSPIHHEQNLSIPRKIYVFLIVLGIYIIISGISFFIGGIFKNSSPKKQFLFARGDGYININRTGWKYHRNSPRQSLSTTNF